MKVGQEPPPAGLGSSIVTAFPATSTLTLSIRPGLNIVPASADTDESVPHSTPPRDRPGSSFRLHHACRIRRRSSSRFSHSAGPGARSTRSSAAESKLRGPAPAKNAYVPLTPGWRRCSAAVNEAQKIVAESGEEQNGGALVRPRPATCTGPASSRPSSRPRLTGAAGLCRDDGTAQCGRRRSSRDLQHQQRELLVADLPLRVSAAESIRHAGFTPHSRDLLG